MRSFFLAFTLLLIVSVPGFGADTATPKETRTPSTNGFVGKPVPGFNAVTIEDKRLSTRSSGARVLIIALWGVNCASCLDEMNELEPIYREFKDQGLRIWAVNTEEIGVKEILKGLRRRNLKPTYDLIPDPGLKITKLFTSWFIPVTVIVDSKGIVQYYKVGYNHADPDKIKAMVGALLAR